METLTGISTIIIFSIMSFLIGSAGMSKWIRLRNVKQPSIEKPPTKTSIYADHVINTAAQIYSGYNESKIIRIGASKQPKIDRQGEALNDAFTLVNRAYSIFDKLDRDGSQIVN